MSPTEKRQRKGLEKVTDHWKSEDIGTHIFFIAFVSGHDITLQS